MQVGNVTAATETLLARRKRLMGAGARLFYDEPVHLVRGEGVWVWDADGRKYLDAYNNVPHVGHCHPRVVEALVRQATTLNTHTRYLHEEILDYIERLTATMGPQLATAILTCTGSEANDVALRMAHAVTGRTGIIATDHCYHGNTAAVVQLNSTSAPFDGDTGRVARIPAPDSLRPLGGATTPDTFADAFAAAVERAIEELDRRKLGVSCILFCPFLSGEGFADLPRGFFDKALARVRKAGGLVIADEVQPGFGRTGSHMWGHQRAGYAPDIVTMGKPMGNGHPIGGVVTSPEIMNTFRSKAMYFNTFGGNPVSCAVAKAVLDVLEDEQLVANARDVGAYALQRLKPLQARHAAIGDIRGSGLFFGAEFVRDRSAQTPAPELALRAMNLMRERGVLVGLTGNYGNVLKIRPPMPFSRDNVDEVVRTFDESLARL